MKETVFKYESNRTLKKSWFIWIVFLSYIAINLMLLLSSLDGKFLFILIWGTMAGFIAIPGLVIHFNYLKYSKNSQLILRYNDLTYIDKFTSITLNNAEIAKIIITEGKRQSTYVPWMDYSWLELIDSKNQKIKISFYLLELDQIRINPLSRRIKSGNVVWIQKLLPIIK